MILYPTETVYALGVNAFDQVEVGKLTELKRRDESQSMSWLVRDLADIERYAVLGERAAAIAKRWLPGPLTLVLKAGDSVPRSFTRQDGTVSFRISTDRMAQKLIADFMSQHDAPLTCTSANLSGHEVLAIPTDILAQFGQAAEKIDTVLDDGPRRGLLSTVVRVIGNEVTVLRAGPITESDIIQS